MKGPSLQKTTALSAALHLTFFIVAALILRQSNSIIIPSPYIVSLVSPAGSSGGSVTESPAAKDTIEKKAAEPIRQKDTAAKEIKDAKLDQKLIEESLAALKAKKKVKDIVQLRAKVL